MNRTVRIGVVGAGWFASRRHLPDIVACPDAELAALCRRSREELDRLAGHFGVARTFTDFGRMLDEAALDALLICTPHALHYEQTRAALERDLHVLVEKPLALTTEQAEELAALAAKRGRVLSTAVNPPFWAHCAALKARREAGDLGEIEAVQLTMVGYLEHVFGRAPLPENLPGLVRPTLFRGDPALNGGGNLMDSGSHLVSELLWVTGLTPRAVTARMDALPTDMRAVLTVELKAPGESSAHPVIATLTAIGDSRHPQRRVHHVYYGSRATATVDGIPFRLTFAPAEGAPETVPESALPPVANPVTDFVTAIREGRPPASPPAHGIAVTRVLEAAYRSAASGARVALP